MGAHPSGSSRVIGSDAAEGGLAIQSATLVEAIAGDPIGMLGPEVTAAWGRLPFLMKVLAAAEPLSLQVHPDATQARAGYAAGAYVDPYPKPELLVAVESFDALCGFKHPDAAAESLDAFGLEALAPVVATLRSRAPVHDRLRRAVERLIGWPVGERGDVVTAVAKAGRAVSAGVVAN